MRVPSGTPNSKHGICDRCGQPFKAQGSLQKRCNSCRMPARLELANQQAKLYYREHKAQIRARKKITEAKRIDHYREMKRLNMNKRRIRARYLIIGYYSHHTFRCACCGERQYDFLELDHIQGGGRREMIKMFGSTASSAFYFWLVRNGFPPGLQVLCSNCNKSKGKHGVCVHQRRIPLPYAKLTALDDYVPQVHVRSPPQG